MIFFKTFRQVYFLFFSIIFLSVACLSQLSLAGNVNSDKLACSKRCFLLLRKYEKAYSIPKNILCAISIVESGKSVGNLKLRLPWPWTVNVNGDTLQKQRYFDTLIEAQKFILKNFIQGKNNIDIGCMQLNIMYHNKNFSSIDQALDPDNNIRYAANYLRSQYKKHSSWSKAIANYHSRDPKKGRSYYLKVLKAKNEISRNRGLI